MKTICQEIAAGKLTRIGNCEIAELRRQAWQTSNDSSKPEEARRYAHLVDEACERELELHDAIEEAERQAEDARYACQIAALAA